MKDTNMPATVKVVLHLTGLGDIPSHQQGFSKRLDKKINRYFDGDFADVKSQAALFGQKDFAKMISNEITSWLEDLGCEPRIADVSISTNKPTQGKQTM